MLHVVNGDATLALLKASPVKGTFLVWKDMLMEGPVSSPSKAKTGPPKTSVKTVATGGGLDWSARAAFLNREYGIDAKKYLADMKAFYAVFDKAVKGKDEVVFWFEEDFFCQIHLAYLLATLPEPLKRKGRSSVICPEKPLGVRLPAAFPKLLAGRIPIEAPLLSLAGKVWSAYSAASSKGWETFLKWARSEKSFEPWPLLKSGLRSHLGRLPSANGGLNALETALLRSVSVGGTPFPLFVRHVRSEPMVRPLGLGDLQVARYALDLSKRGKPLLTIDGKDSSPLPGRKFEFSGWKLHLTPEGKARLAEMTVETPKAAKTTVKTAGKKKAASKKAAPPKKKS